MMMNYCIYQHTSPSGKSYIGRTNNYKRRVYEHIALNPKGCTALNEAIKKYGWDNFTHKILAEGLTVEEANAMEEFAIIELGTLFPGGYNFDSGGINTDMHPDTRAKISKSLKGRPSHLKGKTLSEEHKKKCSEALKGKPSYNKGGTISDEVKKKISESLKGHTTWNKGIPCTDATKAKISESLKGEKNHNFGKSLSDDVKAKMSASKIAANKLKKQQQC